MFSLRAKVQKYGLLLLLLTFLGIINAQPSDLPANADKKLGLSPRTLANGAELRILCLGASISYGWESPDGNGYRYGLRGALRQAGNNVNMIGSVKAGNMNNNEVEGWPGYRIAEVAAKAELSLPSMPNVVLIFVGTNDMTQDYDVAGAPSRMASMIDRIFQAVPNTAVVLATLLPNGNVTAEGFIQTFNINLVGVVRDRQASGKKITLVDMHSDWFSTRDLLSDGTHPTELGYLKMAKVFYNGIVALGDQISPPQSVAGVDDAAAKDDVGAGTALDVVCEQVSGQVMGTAQRAECGLNTIATSAAVTSSTVSPSVAPSSTHPSILSAAPAVAIAVTSSSASPSLSLHPVLPSTAEPSSTTTSAKSSSTALTPSPLLTSTTLSPSTASPSPKTSSVASSSIVSPVPLLIVSTAVSSILLSSSLASSGSVLQSTTTSSTISNPVTTSTKSSATASSITAPSTPVVLASAISSVFVSSHLVSSSLVSSSIQSSTSKSSIPVSSSTPAPATTFQPSPPSKPSSS